MKLASNKKSSRGPCLSKEEKLGIWISILKSTTSLMVSFKNSNPFMSLSNKKMSKKNFLLDKKPFLHKNTDKSLHLTSKFKDISKKKSKEKYNRE
jgi:hypothetical protein